MSARFYLEGIEPKCVSSPLFSFSVCVCVCVCVCVYVLVSPVSYLMDISWTPVTNLPPTVERVDRTQANEN